MRQSAVIQEMCASRNVSARKVSQDMGKTPNFISSLAHSNSLGVDPLLKICKILNFRLAARGGGNVCVFDESIGQLHVSTLSRICRMLGYELCVYDPTDTLATYTFD